MNRFRERAVIKPTISPAAIALVLFQNHRQNVHALGSERHAKAHPSRSLPHRVRYNTVIPPIARRMASKLNVVVTELMAKAQRFTSITTKMEGKQ